MKELKTKCFNCKGKLFEGKFWIYGYNNKKWCTKKCMAESRLKQLRKEINGERISYGEINELQVLKEFIDPTDTQLLEWAGVKE